MHLAAPHSGASSCAPWQFILIYNVWLFGALPGLSNALASVGWALSGHARRPPDYVTAGSFTRPPARACSGGRQHRSGTIMSIHILYLFIYVGYSSRHLQDIQLLDLEGSLPMFCTARKYV